MAKNRKRGSRIALLDRGDKVKKEDSVKCKPEDEKTKYIVQIDCAKLIVYILVAIVGFVVGMILFPVLILVLGSSVLTKVLRILAKKFEWETKFKWKTKFSKKCACVLVISTIIGGAAGYFDIDENLLAACRAFVDPSALKEKNETGIDESPKMQEPKELELEEQEWLEGQPSKVLETINHILVTRSDYESASKNKLSRDISNLVFFLGGQYKIEDWGDGEEILSQVRNLIKDKRGEKNKNVFDQKADEAEKEEINAISEREEKQIKEDVCISDRLNDANTRLNYYSIMPKASLALLIGNDYHLLALIAFCYNYPDNTKIYYYAKCIEYGLEYISFEAVSDETVKDKLIWIAGRYRDIAFTCDGTKEAKWAKLLAEAFECLADEY